MHNESNRPKKTVSLARMRTWQSGLLQMEVHRLTKKYSDEFLLGYGLTTMQWLIIGAILDTADNGIRVTDLAEQAGTTLSYMTTSLNKLQEMCIVCKLEDQTDSRSRKMIVCEHYRPTCLEIEEGLRNIFRKNIYSRISRQELETYITVLQKLSEADYGPRL